jgi:hypothetical protein
MAIGKDIGLRNVHEDLSLQFGSNCDVAGFQIVSTADGNIVLAPDGTGGVGVGGTPARQFHVQGGVGQVDGLHITNTTTGHTNFDGFTLFVDNAGQAGIWQREAQRIYFGVGGTEYFGIWADSNLRLPIDSQQLQFGAAQDGIIEFDGTSFNIETTANNANISIAPHGTGVTTIGDGGTTDYTEFSATGNITLAGSAKIVRVATSIRTITSDDTVLATDSTVLLDGTSNTVTGTLPTAVGITGAEYALKSIDATFTTDVAANGSEEIDGSTSNVSLGLLDAITVQSDGANWWII